MNNVANRPCIARLARRSLRANRLRNAVAILAIALTTILFTALFTVVMSMNYAFQQSNFRQVGGYSHGGFKYLTEEQYLELRDDPLIRQYGVRRVVGMADGPAFAKDHVEVGWSDANNAHWMWLDPVEGHLPTAGTDEAATDLHVLELLGVEPELGAKFTVPIDVDGRQVEAEFTLCGWWERDPAVVASHILIAGDRVDALIDASGVPPQERSRITGTWNLDVMLGSSLHIADDLEMILASHGYQSQDSARENYVSVGVNWGYTGAQLADSSDPLTVLAITALALVMMLTGYLIIYNVFQISVTNDIRFYGLLKTIGTTGRQLRRIIRRQALTLSLIGIPAGLVLGYGVGAWLTPAVLSRLDGVIADARSSSPWIFVGAALFSLVTVLISCRKPGRMAARVSPIEAVRYTEGDGSRRKARATRGVSLLSMAWGNLGRSRKKTVVTILSLSLALVLLTLTVTFAVGFDMDKYLARMAADYQVAEASYFQTANTGFFEDLALSEADIAALEENGFVAEGGRTYGLTISAVEYVTEEYFRAMRSQFPYTAEELDNLAAWANRNEDGLLEDRAQLYGMEPYCLDKLQVVEGDLSPVYEPGSRAIAAVVNTDDYGNVIPESQWARVGDTVTLRYVTKWEHFNPDTGEVYGEDADLSAVPYDSRPLEYRDEEYTVAALVTIPSAMSYRYYGADEFILNAGTFCADTGTETVLYYAWDVQEGMEDQVDQFLQNYTENVNPALDYESKATYAAEFESFRSMFLLLGGVLSAIVGLVGVLNFCNAVLTGIITRRREFAMLQSIGMTGRQLRTMLVCEGLFYAVISLAASLVLSALMGPLLRQTLESLFWFFSYRFTALPIAVCAPILLVIAAMVPALCYGRIARHSIVERLREAE